MATTRTRTTAQATTEGLRIFVAGVPWKVSEDVLWKDFGECGVIEDLFLLRDPEGNSKGRCFITFREADAVAAALKYDNTDYAGRKIFVKLAEEKRGQEPKQQQRGSGEKPDGCVSLCLKNIGESSEADIRKFLTGCGVQAVRVQKDIYTQAARGIAFVDFGQTEDVDKAMELKGKTLNDAAVQMNYAGSASGARKGAETNASQNREPRPRPDEKPAGCTSLCLKNVSDATEDDVREFLDGCGVQSVRVVYDRVTGASRGIAFVDFVSTEDVDKAVKKNGTKLKGPNGVEMRFEAPKERPRPDGCLTVAVKKLPETTKEADILELFKGLKSLSDARVISDQNVSCTGLAFVEFTKAADVEAAVKRDGMSVLGKTVFVCYETKQKKERRDAGNKEAGKKEEAGGKETSAQKKQRLRNSSLESPASKAPAAAKKETAKEEEETRSKEAAPSECQGARKKRRRDDTVAVAPQLECEEAQEVVEKKKKKIKKTAGAEATAGNLAETGDGTSVPQAPKKKKKKKIVAKWHYE